MAKNCVSSSGDSSLSFFRVMWTTAESTLGRGRKASAGASVTREISKIHEETVRGTIGELISHFKAKAPKGEIVMCIGGIDTKKKEEEDE